MKNTLFAQFLMHPQTIGAVCPSSLHLAKALVSESNIEHARAVAELGPGTGAVTDTIIKSMPADSRFFAVELNSNMLDAFKKTFPDVKVFNDNATNLRELIRQENIAALDVVISGLPWAVFSERLQRDILAAVADSLAPNGHFTTFAYIQGMFLPRALCFKKLLGVYFSKLECSKIVWKNLPPAFVYRCRK